LSHLEELKSAGETYLAVLQEFRIEYFDKEGQGIYFSFFEGKQDKEYYLPELLKHAMCSCYVCIKKGNVIKIRDIIKKK